MDDELKFDWGSLVQTVLPTVGTIVGSLLGVESIEDGVYAFDFKGISGVDQDFSSVFYKDDDGDYCLFNQSPNQGDTVSISFPSRGNIGSETVIIPGRQSFEVGQMFHDNAQNDLSKFELSGSSQGAQNNGTKGVEISCSGHEIPVDGQKYAIGSYCQAQVNPQQIVISPKGNVNFDSLSMLSVQGSGDTGMKILDVPVKSQQAQIILPQPLKQGDNVNIELSANVASQSSLDNIIEIQKSDKRFKTPNPDVISRIKNAPRINW